jgi:hypothetical protein
MHVHVRAPHPTPRTPEAVHGRAAYRAHSEAMFITTMTCKAVGGGGDGRYREVETLGPPAGGGCDTGGGRGSRGAQSLGEPVAWRTERP